GSTLERWVTVKPPTHSALPRREFEEWGRNQSLTSSALGLF
ncbi:hypothetical protein RRG08_005384, partial [Elysia crispata]